MSKTVDLSDQMVAGLVRVQRQLMSDWSEERWCAGWMIGLEKEAWHGTSHEMTAYDEDLVAIHDLARITGVWCTWDTDVPLAEWEAQHGRALTRMADKEPTPEQTAALARVEQEQREHMDWILEKFGRKK